MKSLVILGVTFLSVGCAAMRASPPPVLEPGSVRSAIVSGRLFSVVALDFGTEADARGRLTQTLPAMLLTELKKYGRFVVHEAGVIRRGEAQEVFNEGNADELADAYLSGTITTDSGSQVCFEVRLANSHNHEILYADQQCAKVTFREGQISVDRTDVTKLAKTISDSVPQIGVPLKVIGAEDRLLTIELSQLPENMRPLRGMVGLLLGNGESAGLPDTEQLVRDYTGIPARDLSGPGRSPVVGAVYVISVEDRRCLAVLYTGDHAVPGDEIFFK